MKLQCCAAAAAAMCTFYSYDLASRLETSAVLHCSFLQCNTLTGLHFDSSLLQPCGVHKAERCRLRRLWLKVMAPQSADVLPALMFRSLQQSVTTQYFLLFQPHGRCIIYAADSLCKTRLVSAILVSKTGGTARAIAGRQDALLCVATANCCQPPFCLQVLNLIAHRNDSSAAIPRRELGKLIYGRDSVFARSPTEAQVQTVSTADVSDFLHTWERPDNAVFGLVGKPAPV